ncbi:MAG: glutaredoxin family protein [Anaerolineae bacterium]|nr:glutaredoxin family protein [Anaerolineae bacterium]
MHRELVMYGRTTPCPFISTAKRVLDREGIPYRELYIDKNKEHEQRVLDWTGFLSVPTLIIAEAGEELPYETPLPLAKGASPRGINRGSMITEANEEELLRWLQQHGLYQPATPTTPVAAASD